MITCVHTHAIFTSRLKKKPHFFKANCHIKFQNNRLKSFIWLQSGNSSFLVADTQLYKSLCPSVGPSVHLWTRVEKCENAHFHSCPPIRNWYWPWIRPCSHISGSCYSYHATQNQHLWPFPYKIWHSGSLTLRLNRYGLGPSARQMPRRKNVKKYTNYTLLFAL